MGIFEWALVRPTSLDSASLWAGHEERVNFENELKREVRDQWINLVLTGLWFMKSSDGFGVQVMKLTAQEKTFFRKTRKPRK